ncbi:MAG: phage tail protein [Polyangiaceae bacterium]
MQFDASGKRLDPYRNFLFRVKWGSDYVAGVSKVSGLAKTVQAIRHREGGDPNPRMLPGQVDWQPITMERGITNNAEFQKWASAVWGYSNMQGELGKTATPVLAEFRRDMTVELYNESGVLAMTWNIYYAWPSAYVGLSELDALGNVVTIESLTLQHEGFELSAK